MCDVGMAMTIVKCERVMCTAAHFLVNVEMAHITSDLIWCVRDCEVCAFYGQYRNWSLFYVLLTLNEPSYVAVLYFHEMCEWTKRTQERLNQGKTSSRTHSFAQITKWEFLDCAVTTFGTICASQRFIHCLTARCDCNERTIYPFVLIAGVQTDAIYFRPT